MMRIVGGYCTAVDNFGAMAPEIRLLARFDIHPLLLLQPKICHRNGSRTKGELVQQIYIKLISTNMSYCSVLRTPHICHNHHNLWLCKSFESSVKFSTGYMKESALSVISYRVCNLTHGVVFHPPINFTQCVI